MKRLLAILSIIVLGHGAMAQTVDSRLADQYAQQSKEFRTYRNAAIGSAALTLASGGLVAWSAHQNRQFQGAEGNSMLMAVSIPLTIALTAQTAAFAGLQLNASHKISRTLYQSSFYADPSAYLPESFYSMGADVEDLWRYHSAALDYEKHRRRLVGSSICLGAFSALSLGGLLIGNRNEFLHVSNVLCEVGAVASLACVAGSGVMMKVSKRRKAGASAELPVSVSLGPTPYGLGLAMTF